jgi:hypothetical protein
VQQMSLEIVGQSTDTQESIKQESQCDFNRCSKSPLPIIKRVWLWSKSSSQESKRVLTISTHISMLVLIWLWQPNLPQRTMTTLLTKAKPGVWCDYCKSRFTANIPRGQQQADWTVHSELPKSHGRKRSYCNDCVIEVSKWADGSYFALDQQIEYAKTNGNTTQGVLNGF